MRTLSLALLLAAALGLLLSPRPAPAAPGTLDQLVNDWEQHLDLALRTRVAPTPLARQDLALGLRTGAGVGERLGQVVRQLLKGRLSRKGLRSFGELQGSDRHSLEKLARGAGYELLLDLELVLAEGQLHLQGELIATDRLLWRDLRRPDPGSLSHLHASARVDAEVRAFQGGPLAGSTRFAHQSYAQGRVEALALGAGDLDGDGRAELVLLTPRTVEVLRLQPGGFSLLARATLTGTPAGLRPRRAIGSLLVHDLDGDRRAEVLVRSSELEKAAVLRFDGKALTTLRELDGFPLLAGEAGSLLLGSTLAGQDLFTASGLLRLPAAAVPEWQQGLPALFYSLRSTRVPGPRARGYVASVDAGGQLWLLGLEARAPIATLPRVGVALELCDLDDDGRLELVVSGGEGPELDDHLQVLRLAVHASGPAQLRPLWRSPGLGGQVTALTHGDLDSNGKQELIAAVRQRGLLQLMVIQ